MLSDRHNTRGGSEGWMGVGDFFKPGGFRGDLTSPHLENLREKTQHYKALLSVFRYKNTEKEFYLD